MLWVLIRIASARQNSNSTHNISFYGEISKIIPKLFSNTLLICSTETSRADAPDMRSNDFVSRPEELITLSYGLIVIKKEKIYVLRCWTVYRA